MRNLLCKPIPADGPNKAFTLVELLVVISIIIIIAALAIPGFRQAINTARGTQCLSQMRSLGIAFAGYENEHKWFFPASPSLAGEPGSVWYSDNSGMAPYLGGRPPSVYAVCPMALSPKGPLKDKQGRTGYPYMCNYNVMPPAPYTTPVSKFYVKRTTSIVRMIDYNRDYPDYGAGVFGITPDRGERGRVAPIHNGKINILWLDGHVTQDLINNVVDSRYWQPTLD